MSDANKLADALKAIEESIEIDRRLTLADPRRFEGDYAMGLNSYASHLALAGDDAGAVRALEEAVGIRRRLALDRPARYESELAKSLNTLGYLLRFLVRPKGDAPRWRTLSKSGGGLRERSRAATSVTSP